MAMIIRDESVPRKRVWRPHTEAERREIREKAKANPRDFFDVRYVSEEARDAAMKRWKYVYGKYGFVVEKALHDRRVITVWHDPHHFAERAILDR